MKTHDPNNERIKRKYLSFLKEAKRYDESTIDTVAKAFNRFEVYTKFRDFKAFHLKQAIGFKKHLSKQKGQQSGKPLSKATLHATVTQLKRFFRWLAREPGYKSRIQYSDAEYFNLSGNDIHIATSKRQQKTPTIEQIKHVIKEMPTDSEIQCRNRALVAFTLLTGARDSAIASMKLKHVDTIGACVSQDAREVKTKFRKTFNTFFFPVGDEIQKIIEEWVSYLKEKKMWGNDDPLFPSTLVEVGNSRQFEATGLKRAHWDTTSPIRKIFREAFTNSGLPYYSPHSFRNTLAQHGERICITPEHFKAWSQNLGHSKVMTTFTNYGEVAYHRQGEIIRTLATQPQKETQSDNIDKLADILFKRIEKRVKI